MVKLVKVTGTVLCVMSVGAVFAGPEPAVPGTGSAEGPVEFTTPPAAGIPYLEYFNYSAYAKRSYVPGYTPHATSLFENPRDYPWALCVMANPYYQYAGIPGWFFGSPQGYQSSVPPGSHASKYFRGELEITKHLRGGYPQGIRVIEDAIVPISSSVEKGGVFIQGGGVERVSVATETEVVKETRTETGPPAPVPGPAPAPAMLEK